MILLAFVFLAVGLLRPRWERLALVGAALILIAAVIRLAVTPDAVWTGGIGVLRGTRRGFLVVPGELGPWASWDPLGLVMAVAALLATAARARARPGKAPAAVGVVALAVFNDIRLVLMAWSAIALLCHTADRATMTWSWRHTVGVVMTAALGLSVLCAAGVSPALHSHAGHGGALDLDGVGLVSRALWAGQHGFPSALALGMPLLIAASALLLIAGTTGVLLPIAVASGPLLFVKTYPLIETTVRADSIGAMVLAATGTLLVLWAGFRKPKGPSREGLITLGGMLFFVAARLPLEACVWTVVWTVTTADRRAALRGPLPAAVVVSAMLLARWMGEAPQTLPMLAAGTVALGMAMAVRTPSYDARCYVGLIAGALCVLALLPPVASPLWFFLTAKFRFALPGRFVPWVVVVSGAAVGLAARVLLRIPYTAFHDRLRTLENVASGYAAKWWEPTIDTASVIWVALERFGWQGLTLWLPRRTVVVMSAGAAWFQTIVSPRLGDLILHPVAAIGWLIDRFVSTPKALPLLIALGISLAWLL